MDNTNKNNTNRDLDRILNESADLIFENTEKISRSVSSDPTIEKARSEISAQTDSMLREIEERRQRRLTRQREINRQLQAEQEAKAKHTARSNVSNTVKSASASSFDVAGSASDILSSDKAFSDRPKHDSMENSYTPPPSAKQSTSQNASGEHQSTSHSARQTARKSTRQNTRQSSASSVDKQKPKRQIVTPGETQVMPKITEARPVRTNEKHTAKKKSYSSAQATNQNLKKAKRGTSDTAASAAANAGLSHSKKVGAKTSKPKKENGEFNMAKEIRDWVVAIAVAVVLALIIRNFVFTLVRVQGESMMPTLQEGNRLYVNRLFYSPQKGDVVIFRPESDPDRPYIKRVIATEGDTLYIDFETGDVYVNGEIIDEPYINSRTSLTGSYIRELIANGQYSKDNPIVIEKDKIFVMGDNRNNSKDSRELGQIPVDELIGGAVFRFWPLSSFGSVSYDFDTSYLIEDENMNFTIVA